MLAIRQAVQADFAAIAQIIANTFDERIVAQAKHLQHNLVLVAELNDVLVGFAANFLTRSAAGESRFELDLLAVDLAARGRGVGYALLARCIEEASNSGADSIRALVRADNFAMDRICARGGLLRSACPFALYIADAQPMIATARAAHAAHLLPVDTLTYRGIWLEGKLSQAAIDQAHRRAQAENRSRIGALIPAEDEPVAALLSENGFASMGDFFWWMLRLKSAPA